LAEIAEKPLVVVCYLGYCAWQDVEYGSDYIGNSNVLDQGDDKAIDVDRIVLDCGDQDDGIPNY